MSELGRLKIGEKFFVDRRRRGETQTEAAKRLGVSYVRYSSWELGSETPTHSTPKIGRLSVAERCVLYRRRCGFTQARVAKDLKCCRSWVNLMERGTAPVDVLVWYWEQ